MAGEPQRAPRREEPPPKIPGYELLGFIGRGSSGAVYRARQLAVDREVAIKILHPHLARESRVVRRLQREARTTARLAHPHIVSAVDMGEIEGRWWFAMEFVDGPSLAQRLRSEGRIREREALRLFIPLCEALEHLWEHGVVHRDVKPANILIDRTGGARLADLGLAVAEDDPAITGAGGTLGTPHYISPEQAVDPRKADVKSDLWSLGATLYHTVCGRPPFLGESAAEVLSGVLYLPITDPLELEPALSSRLALVLRKCLTRDATRRYQNPHELLLDLELVRERRAPRVARRLLDPVQRPGDHARRTALWVAGGLVAGLALLALLLPRMLGRGETVDPLAAPEAGPFEPLSEIALRHQNGLAKPAELLGELQELEPHLPLRERVRYEELLRKVDAELRKSVRALRAEIDSEIEAEIHAGDTAAGWHTLTDELEPRLVRATGYGMAGLATVGVSLEAWHERLALTLGAATETAVSDFEALLLDWRSARVSEAESSLSQQDWGRAFAALELPDEPRLLAQAGIKLSLPPASKEGFLLDLAAQFRRRTERLHDDWQRLDGELRSFVLTRRGTLERQLREGRPRIEAERMLRDAFERELFDRRLSREKMPQGLSRAGLEELEASARFLAGLEASLLDDDARADYAETSELADEALRRRDYGRALSLWEELRDGLEGEPRSGASSVRAELVRRVDVRTAEARALDGLLERASERVRALDGHSIELLLGSITYPSVRIESGPDPLREGFGADTGTGVLSLSLSQLPSTQLEAFAGFGPETELAPEQRLALAAFRLHEGRAQEAQRALLFSGPPPDEEPWSDVGADLAARIAFALEGGAPRTSAREEEARKLIADVLDAEFRRRSPHVAQVRVARLLDELGDVAPVKQQRAELVKIRAALEENAPRDAELEFRRVFMPDSLEFTALARVKLGYDFGEGRLGAWESGEWVFDGLGFVLGPRAPVLGWDQLAAQRGMRLILRAPLVHDSLDLVVRFEARQDETPARLLWLTAGGFQVLLSAPDLPGVGAGPRYLVGTEDGNAFLQRMLAGEGKRAESLLVPGTPPRELRLKALRRSGRCELYLDGVLLERTSLKAPAASARALQLRSWGSVRVIGVALEGVR